MATAENSTTPARIPTRIYAQLGILVLIWAANWPLTKAVLPEMSPVLFTTVRFIGSAVMMAVLAIPMRRPLLPVAGERVKLALIGIIQIAGMLGFGTFGLQFVGSGCWAGRSRAIPFGARRWWARWSASAASCCF